MRVTSFFLVNIRFTGRHLLPDTVVWFPEKQFPFFRLTEAPISMPWLAPEGKTIITADIGCKKGDEIWSMSEGALEDLCLEHLEKLLPEARGRHLGCSVLRTPVAYPVFINQYEEERQQFEASTGIDNLISVGRNGEFSHIFMEDVYWRTRAKIDALVERLGVLARSY